MQSYVKKANKILECIKNEIENNMETIIML